MIGFDEATELLAPLVKPLPSEIVHLDDLKGRTLAEPVVAGFDAPQADTAAMDGYAVRESDLQSDCRRFPIIGASYPAQPFEGDAPSGSFVRVFTGAQVPSGFDRVITQESVNVLGQEVVLPEHPGPRRHIRATGSDFREGALIVPAGRRITPTTLAAIAAVDVNEASVHRRPRIAILATGDELAAPGTARHVKYAVPDCLTTSLAAMIADYGGAVGEHMRLRDNISAVASLEEALVDSHDIIVITGGASVGARDFAKDLLGALHPDSIFDRLAMKPGKPVWVARARSHFIVGLPGNPSAALVTARLFLAPMIAGLCGRGYFSALGWRKVPLEGTLEQNGAREAFQRGTWMHGAVKPVSHQDSSAQSPLACSDVLIRRPVGDPPRIKGDTVSVLEF